MSAALGSPHYLARTNCILASVTTEPTSGGPAGVLEIEAEFDRYGQDYYTLLTHPVRSWIASSPRFFAVRKWEVLKHALDRLGLDTRNCKWLDVGCGWGEMLHLGQSHFHKASGCDLSPNMLAQARDVHVVRQYAPDALPFMDRSFDLVTTICVYHHILCPTIRKLLSAEIERVLKPGGISCIIEHNPFNPVTRLVVNQTPLDANARLMRASQLSQMMRRAGLQVIAKEFFLFLPEKLHGRFPFVERCLSRFPLGGQYAVFAQKRP